MRHISLLCHSISYLPYFIILDKNNSVKLFHPKWVSSLETVDLGGVFLAKILQKGTQGPTKVHFLCINKWEMVIMNDLEQPMLSYYVIYFEKFRKIMQWTERKALTGTKKAGMAYRHLANIWTWIRKTTFTILVKWGFFVTDTFLMK